jgi:predicted transcriptional regulator
MVAIGTRQYLSEKQGKQEIKKLQKKTSHIWHCTRTEEKTNLRTQNNSLVK